MKLKIFFLCIGIGVFSLIVSCKSQQVQEKTDQVIDVVQEIEKGNDNKKDEEIIKEEIIKEVEPEPEQPKVVNIEGKYTVKGKNKNGSHYEGTVEISKDGDNYSFIMRLNKRIIKGAGTLKDNVVTVKWGNRSFNYQLKEDGQIEGIWGTGQEIFTPAEK